MFWCIPLSPARKPLLPVTSKAFLGRRCETRVVFFDCTFCSARSADGIWTDMKRLHAVWSQAKRNSASRQEKRESFNATLWIHSTTGNRPSPALISSRSILSPIPSQSNDNASIGEECLCNYKVEWRVYEALKGTSAALTITCHLAICIKLSGGGVGF